MELDTWQVNNLGDTKSKKHLVRYSIPERCTDKFLSLWMQQKVMS